jgi:hypothetical protein
MMEKHGGPSARNIEARIHRFIIPRQRRRGARTFGRQYQPNDRVTVMVRKCFLVVAAIFLSACAPTIATVPRYQGSDDAWSATQLLDLRNLTVSSFVPNVVVNTSCRGGIAIVSPGSSTSFGELRSTRPVIG